MVNVTIALFLVLAFFVGLIFLQIFLSKRESRWPGLVLPGLMFLSSLVYPLNMTAPVGGVDVGFVLSMVLVMLFANIPTLIFLAIYAACRERVRRKQQLNRMDIQDLS